MLAQALQLSSATGSPGENVAIEIALQSPAGREPSALQLETTIPASDLNFVDETLSAGPAAKAAGKSVNCAVKPKTEKRQTSVCILYGGQEPIHNGVIAVLRLKISPGAQLSTARIRVDQALAVSKDLKKTPIEAVETAIKIQAK